MAGPKTAGDFVSVLSAKILLPLNHFPLEVDFESDSRVLGIFGPSGCGKTSLLESIIGLRSPRSARILLHEKILTDTATGVFVPPEKRRIGLVPQDLALFPHLNVRQNILYGVRTGDASIDMAHILDVMEIGSLLDRSITKISGGEKQRVAFARALMASPELLILDEPLSSLSFSLKQKIMSYLLRIRDEFKIPMLYVSHDPREIHSLCQEVILMDEGRIAQRGTPQELLAT